MRQNGSCLIWLTPVDRIQTVRNGIEMNSPRTGGSYLVTASAAPEIRDMDVQQKILLTSWLVVQRNAGCSCPTITYEV